MSVRRYSNALMVDEYPPLQNTFTSFPLYTLLGPDAPVVVFLLTITMM
jgi:hypothetical protein